MYQLFNKNAQATLRLNVEILILVPLEYDAFRWRKRAKRYVWVWIAILMWIIYKSYGPQNVYLFSIEVERVIWDEREMTHHMSNPHHPSKSVIQAPEKG